jgi:hypothetical protein
MAIKEGSTTAAEEAEGALKRKASGEVEVLDMFPAKESPMRHWASQLCRPVRVAAAGTGKVPEGVAVEPIPADLFSEDAELRKKVEAVVVLSFPESAALSQEQLEAAVDRIVKESKPETASVAAPGMVRLNDDDITLLLLVFDSPTADELPGVGVGGVFPPGWLDARRKELEEECQPGKKKVGDRAVIVDKVRVDLITRGYVEVHEGYMEEEPEFDPYEGKQPKDYSHLVFCPDDYEGEVMVVLSDDDDEELSDEDDDES